MLRCLCCGCSNHRVVSPCKSVVCPGRVMEGTRLTIVVGGGLCLSRAQRTNTRAHVGMLDATVFGAGWLRVHDSNPRNSCSVRCIVPWRFLACDVPSCGTLFSLLRAIAYDEELRFLWNELTRRMRSKADADRDPEE